MVVRAITAVVLLAVVGGCGAIAPTPERCFNLEASPWLSDAFAPQPDFVFPTTDAQVTFRGPVAGCLPELTAEVTGPDGAPVQSALSFEREGSGSRLAVRFGASQPGAYQVALHWTTSLAQSAWLEVVEPVPQTGAFEQRFVDRMDTCISGPFRVPSGRTLCRRDGDKVWVYGRDGSLAGSLDAQALAVAGSDVWLAKPSAAGAPATTIEHYTDTAGGLQRDASVDEADAVLLGEAAPGRLVWRTGSTVVEGRWNGSALTVRRFTGLPDVWGLPTVEGDAVWALADGAACRYERGCQTIDTCAPVRTCYALHALYGADAEALFLMPVTSPRGWVALAPRPLGAAPGPARPAPPRSQGMTITDSPFPLFTVQGADGYLEAMLLPVRDANGFHFQHLRSPLGNAWPVSSCTDDWLVTPSGDPFTLRFIPR